MKKLQKDSKKNNKIFFQFFEIYLGPKNSAVLMLQFENRKENKS
jgi:hypothetical protein